MKAPQQAPNWVRPPVAWRISVPQLVPVSLAASPPRSSSLSISFSLYIDIQFEINQTLRLHCSASRDELEPRLAASFQAASPVALALRASCVNWPPSSINFQHGGERGAA